MQNDPLANLRDIHLPPPIHHWPIGKGFIGLFLLAAISLIFAIILLRRRINAQRPKKQAMELLAIIRQNQIKNPDIKAACHEINTLLKRVAVYYHKRNKVADLRGQAWLNFLNKTGKEIDFNKYRDYLLLYPYQKTSEAYTGKQDPTLMALINHTEIWIKHQKEQP
ncbi:MAG: hypothetical protein A3F18_03425 [Legionellales bacterium RIFCSPHIGHO2_12_FULL_37_14]|nr:MAG: hypothetical protein A3F18_03425 [Legionellales bacterium RIFCSPHIGHO2_12_FULL_37_14]